MPASMREAISYLTYYLIELVKLQGDKRQARPAMVFMYCRMHVHVIVVGKIAEAVLSVSVKNVRCNCKQAWLTEGGPPPNPWLTMT